MQGCRLRASGCRLGAQSRKLDTWDCRLDAYAEGRVTCDAAAKTSGTSAKMLAVPSPWCTSKSMIATRSIPACTWHRVQAPCTVRCVVRCVVRGVVRCVVRCVVRGVALGTAPRCA